MRTVRARLLGVMSLVVIPVAVGIGVVAYSGYVVDERDARVVQVTSANGRAQSIRSWLEQVGRSLIDQSVEAGFLDADRCAEFARTFVRLNTDYAAVRLVDAAGQPCGAGEAVDLLTSAAGVARLGPERRISRGGRRGPALGGDEAGRLIHPRPRPARSSF